MTPVLAQRLRTDRTFERMYRKHLGDVYRYALAVMRNPADAEDVTQTTFLNAYRALERGDKPRNPHNWLIAIAHNVCRQRFRQSARRPEEVAYEDGIGELVPEEETGPSVDDIQRALGHLAFNQRAALVMRELRDAVAETWGKTLPLNVAMAIAAAMLDVGFPVAALKAVPILARTAGLLAHLADERERPVGFRLARAAEEAVE
jgi:RNA polymerase sigma factor (sigma-70 family)